MREVLRKSGGSFDIRLDSLRGKLLTRIEVPHTGGWEQWQTVVKDLETVVEGVHDVYFVFRGRKGVRLMSFDWWKFRGIEECNMPLFTTKYTADPSPLVVGDTLFLYVSHDAHLRTFQMRTRRIRLASSCMTGCFTLLPTW